MNVDNGPGSAPNSDFVSATQAFRAAGGRLLGYVYTCYGGTQCASGPLATRSTGEVLARAQRYAQWYGVDGIFLDEMSNQLQDLPFYSTIASGLRSARPQWQIVGNPGTATPADYLAVADVLVTSENGGASYAGAPSLPWMSSAAPDRQAHLLYNVSGTAAMQSLLLQAQTHGAGHVYITDDRYTPGSTTETNPWDALPSYWTAELAAVSAVPQPPASALALVGLGWLAWRLRRRIAGRPS
jgi:hypothetical protein